jgi:hypothetical protein
MNCVGGSSMDRSTDFGFFLCFLHYCSVLTFLLLYLFLYLYFYISTTAAERRRREEGWTDLGLDQLDRNNYNNNSNTATGANQHPNAASTNMPTQAPPQE